MQTKPTIVFLLGPTASGKTALAMEWIKRGKSYEIISVDSAMVYKGLNIGTGKPTALELSQVPHHLIDIREPYESYSAADFRVDALELIPEILARGNTPLLVGGTLLYVRALQHGLSPLPSADPIIRDRLLKEAKVLGWQAMHQRLAEVDPVAASRIHVNDPQRIQRALEIYAISGKSMSDWFAEQKISIDLENQYQIQTFALGQEALDPAGRGQVHENIAKRFNQMIEQGLIEEVKQILEKLNQKLPQREYKNLPAMRSVGYRQVCEYLEGELSYDEMVNKAIASTRQLAKRQLTWLRSLTKVNWLA